MQVEVVKVVKLVEIVRLAAIINSDSKNKVTVDVHIWGSLKNFDLSIVSNKKANDKIEIYFDNVYFDNNERQEKIISLLEAYTNVNKV